MKKLNKYKKGKISLCSKNRLGKNGSLFKVNGGMGSIRKNQKTTAAVFPRGSKKRISNNDDKHDHGQEKGDTQHYVEGIIIKRRFVWMPSFKQIWISVNLDNGFPNFFFVMF